MSKPFIAKEWKVVCLRETPAPDTLKIGDNPNTCAQYWQEVITTGPHHMPDVESFYVLHLSTRRHVRGHNLIAHGTLDTVLVHPREVFRNAIIASAAAIILMHNHPSGDSTPSESDINLTRRLVQCGQILGVEVLDHIIIGQATQANPKGWHSLRELGYFYSS